jgi:uncharacterized protein YuzE
MRILYYPDTDTLAFDLRPEPATDTDEWSEDVLLDYNEKRQLVGITIEGASRNVDLSTLEVENLPAARSVGRSSAEVSSA